MCSLGSSAQKTWSLRNSTAQRLDASAAPSSQTNTPRPINPVDHTCILSQQSKACLARRRPTKAVAKQQSFFCAPTPQRRIGEHTMPVSAGERLGGSVLRALGLRLVVVVERGGSRVGAAASPMRPFSVKHRPPFPFNSDAHTGGQGARLAAADVQQLAHPRVAGVDLQIVRCGGVDGGGRARCGGGE